MHRTQIMLTEEQYQRLKRESERSGRSIADIVRSAIDEVFNTRRQRTYRALKESRGAWADRDDIGDGASYVEEIRQPLDERLREMGWD